MIKSNQLKIITRDAGASGLHSNAAHWNEEPFVLFNKIYHIVILSHNSWSQWLRHGALERGKV